MADIICTIGARAAQAVTIDSVSGTSPGPYTVTLNAAVPGNTKIGDAVVDSASAKFLITGVSGNDLTVVKYPFNPATDPATGAATTRRAFNTTDHANLLQSWHDAAPASLVTATERWIGECQNDGLITNAFVDFGAQVKATDASNYFYLRAGAGQGFNDHASKLTNALRYNASNGVAFRSSTLNGQTSLVTGSSSYLTVEGIQFQHNAGGSVNSVSGIVWVTRATAKYVNCIFEANGTAIYRGDSTGTNRGRFINCVMYCTQSGTAGIRAFTDQSADMYNCTVFLFGATSAACVINASTSTVVKNTIGYAAGSGADFSGTVAAGSTNNVSSDSSAPGSGSLINQTLSTLITNDSSFAAFDAKPISATLNVGVRDQTNTADLDILKIGRSTSFPTIGAMEFTATITLDISSSAVSEVTADLTVPDKVVSVELRDDTGAPWANQLFDWAFYDAPRIKDAVAPVAKGTASTDENGLFTVVVNGTALAVGSVGRLVVGIANTDAAAQEKSCTRPAVVAA